MELSIRCGQNGIGDAICGMYAASGAAAAGHRVQFHTPQAHWLRRASFDGVEVLSKQNSEVINACGDYDASLLSLMCRKQWYCDAISAAASVDKFRPSKPVVDRTVTEKRIDHERYVLLFPYSAWNGRNWPEAHWQRLSFLLQDAGYGVVALDSAGDGARISNSFGTTTTSWYWGMNPEWVFDAMLGAEAVIGNDSGMTHLAGMLGVKTIAIHSQVPKEQLWGYTDVISLMPQADCIGCVWQYARGWRKPCDAQCSALYTVSPSRVLAAVEGGA